MVAIPPDELRERLDSARLYFVCDRRDGGEGLAALLDDAVAGGVDVIQLRDKEASREELAAAAAVFREVAGRHRIPFLMNDDPQLALEAGADGVHVGQDDVAVAAARSVVGEEALIGLSTHSQAQLAAAHDGERPDYVSVGPVWETPTKPGRPGTGIDYVKLAAERCELPWFAIGSIDEAGAGEVARAGATRVVVVRAIRDAADPRAAAERIRGALLGAAVG